METLVNNIITAFGWSIFHSLWQGAIIYGLLFLALTTIPRLSARWKHNLAFGSICLMFGSFLLSFVSNLKIPTVVDRIHFNPAVALPPELSATTGVAGLAVWAERYFPLMVMLYAAGVLIQIGMLIYSYRKLELVKSAEHSIVPPVWQQRFEQVLLELRIRRPVQFRLSDKVNVPLVIGFFKPLILFPVSMATQLDIQQVEAILIHELSHIRRNDFLLNLIKTAIETVLFFNPFVWLSSRFIRMEREHDCDDRVVKFTGKPLTYAHALLQIEILKEKDTPALSLAASGNSQHLYHRIKRITDMKTTYMNAKQRMFAVALTLGTILSIAWVSPSKEKELVKTAAEHVMKRIERISTDTHPSEIKQNNPRMALSLPIDTPKKKKKVKIITVDEKGNKREYNSVSELPDSLKAEGLPRVFSYRSGDLPKDSAMVIGLSSGSEKFREYFDTPETRAKLEKLGAEMQKKGEAMAKRFNNPEERAKWEKLGLSMQKQGEAFAKKFNAPEEQAKRKALTESLRKHAEELRLKMNDPAQQESFKKLSEELRKNSKELQKMMLSPEVESQFKDLNFSFIFGQDAQESIALKNSEEYKKLKKSFDEKVEKLKKKQEKRKS